MDLIDSISITCPDDWHLHLRDGAAMRSVLPHSVQQFGRAIVMPNLTPAISSVAQAAEYRQRILAALPEGERYMPSGKPFEPLMTLYLTEQTSPEEIKIASESGFVHAVKLYPAGATTNSADGLGTIENAYPALEAMQEHDLPLLIHGEVVNPAVDVFDREHLFIDHILSPLVERFTRLRIVLEHITTREAVSFIEDSGSNVAATITAHHLLYSRNALLVNGIHPHLYCMPVLKRETHRQALITAAISGNRKFFLGTDSAPHSQSAKESSCGCAGCYTAFAAMPLYAQVFAEANALGRLEAFASFHGADFYRLPRNTAIITLRRKTWRVPDTFPLADEQLVPLCAGKELAWQLVTQDNTDDS